MFSSSGPGSPRTAHQPIYKIVLLCAPVPARLSCGPPLSRQVGIPAYPETFPPCFTHPALHKVLLQFLPAACRSFFFFCVVLVAAGGSIRIGACTGPCPFAMWGLSAGAALFFPRTFGGACLSDVPAWENAGINGNFACAGGSS